MDRGLDAAIGIVHVECVRSMCASPQRCESPLTCSRAFVGRNGREGGTGGDERGERGRR